MAAGILGSLGNADIAGAGAAVSQLLIKPTTELGKALAGDNQVIEQLITNVASATAGYAAGGNAGAATASVLEMYNRQLHRDRDESKVLESLKAGRSDEERHRLDAAACALVKCAEGVAKNDPHYTTLSALQQEGSKYEVEQDLLRSQGLLMFSYIPGWDNVNDWRSRHDESVTRAKGSAEMAGGVLAAGGSAAFGAGLCVASTGVGCAAGATVAAVGSGFGVNHVVSGAHTAFGPYQSTEGAKVLASFDPNQPPSRSPLMQDVIDLGVLGLEAGFVKDVSQIVKGVGKAVDKAADVTPVAKGTEKISWGSWNDYKKVTIDGKEYAQIGNRIYTRHAVDRMQPSGLGTPVGGDSPGRSFPPSLIDDVIRNGVERTIHSSGTAEVVTERGGRVVVTVNPFRGG